MARSSCELVLSFAANSTGSWGWSGDLVIDGRTVAPGVRATVRHSKQWGALYQEQGRI